MPGFFPWAVFLKWRNKINLYPYGLHLLEGMISWGRNTLQPDQDPETQRNSTPTPCLGWVGIMATGHEEVWSQTDCRIAAGLIVTWFTQLGYCVHIRAAILTFLKWGVIPDFIEFLPWLSKRNRSQLGLWQHTLPQPDSSGTQDKKSTHLIFPFGQFWSTVGTGPKLTTPTPLPSN